MLSRCPRGPLKEYWTRVPVAGTINRPSSESPARNAELGQIGDDGYRSSSMAPGEGLVIRNWFKYSIAIAAVLVALAATLSPTKGSKAKPEPDGLLVPGRLLVASTDIGDPQFDRAVVLLLRHDRDGAMGIVINRPVEERPLASVMKAIGADATGVEGRVLLFAGGPVALEIGLVLHSVDYHRAKTLDIDGHVAMTSTHEILRDIGHKRGPAKFLIAFGYCGWAPGQLESELAEHVWIIASADPKLIFDDDRGSLWQEALARRLRPL
jgi:putative transcriptional regulator